MARYFIERVVLTTLLTLLLLSMMTFTITRALLPGDLRAIAIEEYGWKDPDVGAKISQETGLGPKTPREFARWLGLTWPFNGETGVLQGDFGESLASRKPVTSELFRRLAATLELALLAQVIALAVALPLGFVAGLNRGKWPDRVIGGLSRLGAYPSVILAIQFVVLAWALVGWIPPRWYYPIWEDPLENLRFMLAPSIFLALMPMGIFIRLARRQSLEVLDDPTPGTNVFWLDRVRALKDTRVRTSLVPIVLGSTMSLQLLLGVTVLYEYIFIVPGIGRLTVDAVNFLDYPVSGGLILILGSILVAIARIGDLASVFLLRGVPDLSPDSPLGRASLIP